MKMLILITTTIFACEDLQKGVRPRDHEQALKCNVSENLYEDISSTLTKIGDELGNMRNLTEIIDPIVNNFDSKKCCNLVFVPRNFHLYNIATIMFSAINFLVSLILGFYLMRSDRNKYHLRYSLASKICKTEDI